MGKEAFQQTKGTFGHSKELSLKSFPNLRIKDESKEVN
jgi:hypothetical protein